MPLPADKVTSNLPALISKLENSEAAVHRFAQAIMTTDTREKLASATVRIGNSQASILGVAKGSGMIHPQLATMLVYLFTDIAASPAQLKRLLREAVR